MTAQNFAKLYAHLSKLLSELTDEELTAAVEGKALLALTVEYKSAAKKVGGAAKKAPKPPAVSAYDLAASLNTASTRTEALNLIEGSKPTGSLLKEVAALLNLPATGTKAAITNRIVDHIGSRADAQVLRNW